MAACNINTALPTYLETDIFTPQPSCATISNAMDVGNPSNFARMLELYGHSAEKMREGVVGYSFSDEDTRAAMREVNERTGYTLDPHGAVGYLGLRTYQKIVRKMVSGTISEEIEPDTIYQREHPDSYGIFLETAHPAKFREIVEPEIGRSVDIPERLAEYRKKEKQTTVLPKTFDSFKEFLLNS